MTEVVVHVAVDGLGRFGHHPDASTDFDCEVDELIAMAYDRLTGMEEHSDLEDRIRKAMEFRTILTPLELRWMNQHFNGAREIYSKMPECIVKIADKVPVLFHPPATATPASPDLVEALEAYDRTVENCAANKAFLGDKPCPKCGAGRSEGCRPQISATFTVVEAAKQSIRAALAKAGAA